MPRFFFDFDEGDATTIDIDGQELGTAELASDEAMNALLEIVRSKLPRDRRQAISCHLKDEAGQLLCSITLTLKNEPHGPVDLLPGRGDRRLLGPESIASSR